MLPEYSWIGSLPLEWAWFTLLSKINPSNPSELRVTNNSLAGSGTWWWVPWDLVCLKLAQVLCMLPCCAQLLCCVQKTLFLCHHPSPLALTLFPPALLQWSLRLGRRGSVCMFHLELSIPVSYSLNFGQLSQSPTIVIRIFWWGLSYEPIYAYNNKLLGVCLILYLFSRIIVLGSPLLTYDLCSQRFLATILVPGMEFAFWGRLSQCECDWLFPCHFCCYIALVFVVGPVIVVAHRVYSRRILMITFLLPGPWMISNRDEASRWVPAWFLHAPRLEYVVSSNAGSYCQVLDDAKSMVSSLQSLVVYGTQLPINSKRSKPLLALGFLFVSLWCLVGALPLCLL